VLDTYKGKHIALANSLDFQYMRTVFRLEDPLEDGFVFMSDPFIRNLVGPATRIKERRRLEALTSLAMVTNGALFTAWETGKLPANHTELLNYTGSSPTSSFLPTAMQPCGMPSRRSRSPASTTRRTSPRRSSRSRSRP